MFKYTFKLSNISFKKLGSPSIYTGINPTKRFARLVGLLNYLNL